MKSILFNLFIGLFASMIFIALFYYRYKKLEGFYKKIYFFGMIIMGIIFLILLFENGISLPKRISHYNSIMRLKTSEVIQVKIHKKKDSLILMYPRDIEKINFLLTCIQKAKSMTKPENIKNDPWLLYIYTQDKLYRYNVYQTYQGNYELDIVLDEFEFASYKNNKIAIFFNSLKAK